MGRNLAILIFAGGTAACAVGWYLLRETAEENVDGGKAGFVVPENPTFARDVAPLLNEKCVTCHRPGQVAPFSLLTYEDAKKRARQLVEVTQSRYMPPFLPDASVTRFLNARHLSDAELELLKRWQEQGGALGDESELPATPSFVSSDWQLGTPDLIVSMDREYTLPAEGENIYRQFVVPVPTTKQRYVRGFEFRATNPRIVHHARFLFDKTGESRALDEADEEPGFTEGMGGAGENPDGHWLGWTPGKQPVMRDSNHSWPLEPNSDLIIELHMVPTGKPEPIRCEMAFYYSDKKPQNRPAIVRMGPTTIDIPAGEKSYPHRDQFQIPVDVQVLNVYPHAHLLAKSMRADATLDRKSVV